MEIKLTKDEKIKISYTKDLYEIMRRILLREERFGRNREHFWVVGLDKEYTLLFIELVALGNGNQSLVNPNEVFQLAIHKQSTFVILVHNHPGGDPAPSEADIDLTDRLIHAAEMINLRVIEHLILCGPDLDDDLFYSFTEKGLMDKLEKSKKYAVHYIEEAKILKKGTEIGKEAGIVIGVEKGEKNKAIEMAKASIKEGLPTELISKLTGLLKTEINKLSKTKSKTGKKTGS